MRKAVVQQIRYVQRNFGNLDKLLKSYDMLPLNCRDVQYLEINRKIYVQQMEMYIGRTQRLTDRIVCLHQPYVRPIVRVKEKSYEDFGSKINVSVVNGYSFIDRLSWDAYNEGY